MTTSAVRIKERLLIAGARRIEQHGLLVRVEIREQTAAFAGVAAGRERSHRAGLCAAGRSHAGRFHLDDAGPEIRKQFAAILGRDTARQLKDPQIAQCGHCLLPFRQIWHLTIADRGNRCLDICHAMHVALQAQARKVRARTSPGLTPGDFASG
jgi:hypothetical protein